MYAVYNYKAGSTQAQVLSDIVAILTGTTLVSSLSASCVQVNSSIVSTEAAGWSVYDASAGTNQQVLRVLNQDATTFKYWGVQMTTTTAFTMTAYESFNSSTHVGTNTCTSSTGAWDATNGGFFYIYATPKNIVFLSWLSATGYKGLTGSLFEITRDTIPSTYPCWILDTLGTGIGINLSLLGSTSGMQIPRVKNVSTTGDTLTSSTASSMGYGVVTAVGNATSVGGGYYRDASETQYVAMNSTGAVYNGTWLGSGYDLKAVTILSGVNILDEIVISGVNYVNFGNGVTTASSGLWVPKK
jgi:hypothetical protein